MSAFLISRADMIAQQAQIFDQLRTGSEVCFLIKHEPNTKKFAVVREFTTGWFVSWDKFREALLLRIAIADSVFTDEQAQGSFIAYGTPDTDGDIYVYPMPEDKRDKIPPTETNPSWKFFIERDEGARFRVPD